MKFTKILTTALALGVFSFSGVSSAVLIDLRVETFNTSNTSTSLQEFLGVTDYINYDSFNAGNTIDGWLVQSNVAKAGQFAVAPDIFSLSTDASLDPFSDSTTLVVTSTAYGLTDLGVLGGHFSSIGFVNSSVIDISTNNGTTWTQLGLYNSLILGASSENIILGVAPSSSYDLRITQTFFSGVTGAATSVSVPATTVPEPSIIALIGFGLIGMGVVTRRKQKSV